MSARGHELAVMAAAVDEALVAGALDITGVCVVAPSGAGGRKYIHIHKYSDGDN
jgi:hypothetical protein